MSKTTLNLIPSDVLMFRESRPFDQVTTASDSVFPTPRAIAGAVRTWLLNGMGQDLGDLAMKVRKANLEEITRKDLESYCDEGCKWVLKASIRGPFLAQTGTRLFPLPLHMVDDENDVCLQRLCPVQDNLPGYNVPQGADAGTFRHLWLPGGKDWTSLDNSFLDSDAMAQALASDGKVYLYDIKPSRTSHRDYLWRSESRYGIVIHEDTRTVEEGALYASEFMRFRDGISLQVEIESEVEDEVIKKVVATSPWMKLGGEGKTAWVEIHSSEFTLPKPPSDWKDWNSTKRFFTTLITPGRFKGGGWIPVEMAKKYKLVSAITGAPIVFSGWDGLLNRPLKTKYAARMGSVYFWERKDKCTEKNDPHGTSISDEQDDKQAGWGICLRGDWDYAK